MPGESEEYAINELAKKASVSVRTIRFYINEGLLPAPQTRGRYTVYNDEYLDRLELIRRLKDSFLPLKEIRATLASLNWDEVRSTLADLRKRDAQQDKLQAQHMKEPDHKVGEKSTSALEYISDLISSTPANRPLPPKPAAPASRNSRIFLAQPGPESWQRILLAQGLELHVRQPVQPQDQPKIEEILQLAQKLFSD